MFQRILQLYRCTAGIPVTQLGRRLQLQLKRRLLSSSLGAVIRSTVKQPVALKEQLPKSLFAPRSHLVERISNVPHLSQLGTKIPLIPPLDWNGNQQKLRHLDRLTLHYHEFLETLEFEEGRAVICDWIDRNCPWKKGYWLDSWNSYAISIRTVCWFQWLAQYRGRLNEAELDKIKISLSEQLHFLLNNLETDICGNHLLKNIRCLLWASACLSGDFARHLQQTGWSLLQRELPRQLLDDGMHFELSPAYHCQIFADLVDCCATVGEQEATYLKPLLHQSAQTLKNLTHPDGLISLMSDGGLHMVYSPHECLSAWTTISSKPIVNEEVFYLPTAGYAGVRTPRTYLLFDAGPACAQTLPAHGHGDLLSFEFDIDGKRFVVDPGVFEYESGEARKWNRSAFSHNVVIVDNWDQCEFIGSFRTGWRNQARFCQRPTSVDSHFEMSGEYTHCLGRFKHRRTLYCRSTGLTVEDDLEGVSQRATAKLLINGEFAVIASTINSIEFAHPEMRIVLSSPFAITYSKATWSPDFGSKLPATQISIDYGPQSGKFGFEFSICSKS
jgi:plastocyanin